MSEIITVNEAAAALLGSDNYLILTHKNPDGDTICSAAALCSALKRCGKTAFLADNTEIIPKYRVYSDCLLAPVGFKYDKVIAVDCATEQMFASYFDGKVFLTIDHHPTNSLYSEKVLLNGNKSSCGEIIIELIETLCNQLSKEEAELLYIALITDNGCFQYANTNADSFDAAAKLVRYGINNGELSMNFFRKLSYSRIKLESEMYANIRLYRDGKISLIPISQAMLDRCGCTENDLSDLAGIAGRCEGALLNITLREKEYGKTKVSVRSCPDISSSDICAFFGGGGHHMAAGCTIDADLAKAEQLILEAVDKVWQ